MYFGICWYSCYILTHLRLTHLIYPSDVCSVCSGTGGFSAEVGAQQNVSGRQHDTDMGEDVTGASDRIEQ